MKKVIRLIREKRFFATVREHVLYRIKGKNKEIIDGMLFLPDNRQLNLKNGDYVREHTLELTAYEINNRGIKGDVAELGVYQGNFAKLINRVFPGRTLYLFDTFEGFDKRDQERDQNLRFSNANQDFSKTTIDDVLSVMPNKEKCVIKAGWFPETAIGLENNTFAFVSIDADLFDPIYQGLKFFYPRLACGGVIFVHDYNNKEYMGASEAVKKFCDEEKIGFICIPDICGTAILTK